MAAKRRSRWVVAVGGGPCPVCGLDGDVVVAPGRWGRLRGWLAYGQAPAPTLRCVDGHEWTAGATGWLTDGGGRFPSWWRWPVRAVRVLLDHRTAEPVPRFWLAAGVVGVVLGVAVQVTLGWRWWLVTVLWLAVVWLVFLTTALRPLGRDGLWIELVGTVSHRHAEQLEDEQLIRLIQAAPGPVYGLADWTGRRSLGGHGRSSSVGLTHVELMYGDPVDGPHLRISTSWKRPGRPDVEPDGVRQELTRALWHHQMQLPEGLDPEELHQWVVARRVDIDRRPVPKWTPTRVLVDGTDRVAETYVEGDDWAAVIDLDHALVVIQSRGIPTNRVSLTQVQDLTPYTEASMEFRNRDRKHRPPT